MIAKGLRHERHNFFWHIQNASCECDRTMSKSISNGGFRRVGGNKYWIIVMKSLSDECDCGVSQVVNVVVPVLAVNEDTGQVRDYERVEVLSENIIHERHEHCWGISQSDQKELELEGIEMPAQSLKRGQEHRLFVETDLVVSKWEINLDEVFAVDKSPRILSMRGRGYLCFTMSLLSAW